MPHKQRSIFRSIAVLALTATFLLLSVTNLKAQEGRKAIAHPTPNYPQAARKYGLKGVVKVEVVIAADGHIKETKVIGGHPLLVAAVQDTLKNWKYAPASSESTALLDFNFHSESESLTPENNSEKGKR